MGIKHLHTFLQKTVPCIYETVHLSEYEYKRIAVDTAIYLCKFKTSWGDKWLSGFVQMCAVLRSYAIHPLFIFDNVFPTEKMEERQRRSDARRQQRQRIEELRTLWESHRASIVHAGASSVKQYCELDDERIPITLYSFLFKTFISTDSSHGEMTGHKIAIDDIDREFVRLENNLLMVSPADYDQIRELLRVFRIPYVLAIGEAEATASYLCQEGLVDAVLTDDTDVLAYGTPLFLHRLNLQDHSCTRIDFKELLRTLDMTPETFVDFCILSGTDYNQNLPKIGNQRAFKLLREYGSIEGILEHLPHLDPSHSFPFHRVRQMFTERPAVDGLLEGIGAYCDFPDWEEIIGFLTRHECTPSIDLVELSHQLFKNPSIRYPSSTSSTGRVPHHGPSCLPGRPSLLRPPSTA